MDKIWLKNYQAGVPQTINPDEYSSVVAMAEESFQKYAEQPCYYNMGAMLTYQQVDERSRQFAHYLQRCGLKKGDRVAIILPNVLQFPIALFGILRAGMVCVNVNPLYTATEMNHVLKDSGAKCAIVLANFAHVLAKAIENLPLSHVVVTELGDQMGFKGKIVNFVVKYFKKMVPAWNIKNAEKFNAILAASPATYDPVTIEGDDVAFLQYTGGTTGGMKGAILTHRNMVANMLQAYAWISPFLHHEVKGGIVTALPLYHIFSLTANCLVFLRTGVPNILITNPRDIPRFIQELKRQPFSIMTGVNTLFNALLHHEEFKNLDFSNFIFSLGGGMAVQRTVAEKWQKVTGAPLLEAYGLTETAPAVTINPLNLRGFNGSIGLPLPSTNVKICDEAGVEMPIGEAGELLVQGPQVMRGYWNQPEKTRDVLDENGWLRTGDIATIDHEGYLRLVDRKKDIIIVSGFNVYPNEIEDVIAKIPGVREVAVVGQKSEVHGEIVKAYIVRSDPALTPEQIVIACQRELTGYKIPKEIEFRDDLPKTNVGKVLRRQLRDEQSAN